MVKFISFWKKAIRKIFKVRVGEIFLLGYTTTKSGVIDELTDTEELDERVEAVIEHLKSIGENEKMKLVLEQTITPEMISSKFLKVLNFFHLPYNEEFSLKEELIEEFQLPNKIIEENKISGEWRNSLIYLDENTGIGEIQIDKKYDQQTLNNSVKNTLIDIDERLERSRDVDKIPLFVATESFWYKVNFNSGWILDFKYEKVYLGKDQENITRIALNFMGEI